MNKIGVIYGMENTFPPALVDKINSMNVPDVVAEHVLIGAVKMAEPSGYKVIVDRISHDIAFYRAYLKNAALSGAYIINNPFWWGADDKFFNMPWRRSWGWRFRRRWCCRTRRIRQGPRRSRCGI